MNLKKPKFWDYKKPNLIAYLLYPISLVIQLLKIFLNKPNVKKSKIKTVCIGNIYVGGTGKTSLSIKLNKILKQRGIKSCFIKKFHRNQIDEHQLLKNNGKLFLSNTRLEAIEQAEAEKYDIAILDDGLQDNSVKCDVNFVCFNTINWIGNGMTIPSGPLREEINNLLNYKNIFLNGNLENLNSLKDQINKMNPSINIHVGKYNLTNLEEFDKNEKYLAFSGIGNHKTFISMIKNNGLNILKEFEFPDHYKYKHDDIDKILSHAKKLNCKIITTEKDYLRLDNQSIKNVKFIKTELNIIDEEKFIKTII
tara:strand:- start:2223 stop:3149 length:927 start_codon:yes stop_codon:yes gene_type:complete